MTANPARQRTAQRGVEFGSMATRQAVIVLGMRLSGVVADVRSLGSHDHVCWGFDDDADFRAAAVAFLDAGLALGHRVRYVGEPGDGVHTALAAARPGAIEVVPVDAQYAPSTLADLRAHVEAYATATADALAAGFTGLRVATDATALVARPTWLDAAARYEHRVDHLMVRQPLSAMCAYNRAVLGADALAQLATMHPVATGSMALFRLHASSAAGCAAAIGGELDISCAELLGLALERAELRPVCGELVLDAAELTFVDQARLAVLVEHARHLGATLVLRTDQPVPRRLVRMLDWPNVRIEAVT